MEEVYRYDELDISPHIKKAVAELGFEEMTEAQRKVIPIMKTGRDVVCKAPTGTGKTFAFGIPIVDAADPEGEKIEFLILAPTRELAVQINDELRKLLKHMTGVRSAVLYGGQPIDRQIMTLKRRPQIIVATPGRLLDHMGRKTVRLDEVKTVVLDEADEMLDMGFFKDVSKILDALPENKQIAMFSATISREVMDIMWLFQRDAAEVTVAPEMDNEPKIKQYSLECHGLAKTDNLYKIITLYGYSRVMCFCNTRRCVDMVYRRLKGKNMSAEMLSSDVNQGERNRIMAKFKSGELDVLVATDVASRGIDVDDVDVVFNYDVPQDNTSYLHRIGRTGRAKKEGVSYMFHDVTESARLKEIIRYTKCNITPLRFSPGGILEPVR